MKDREKLLEQLTGVNSSKLNYYVELKKTTEEALKQNSRLEILYQLTRDINIDMSIQDILDRTFSNLGDFRTFVICKDNRANFFTYTIPGMKYMMH